MDTQKWFKGLPHPISWLRTIALTVTFALYSNFLAKVVPMSPAGIAIWLFASWVVSAVFMATYHHHFTRFLFWAATWYPPSFPGYQDLQQRTAAKTKSNWDSQKEGINALIVSLVAAIIAIACFAFLLYLVAPGNVESNKTDEAVIHLTLDTFATLITAVLTGAKTNQSMYEVLPLEFEPLAEGWNFLFYVWVASALLLYQYDFWVRSWRVAKLAKEKEAVKRKTSKKTSSKSKKSKPKKSQPLADPIEVELNQLSAEFGVTAMRPVRKTSSPEKTQWYVFRSGNAEGPYTREQLWLAQRITARTNVRREGETDWTRAGEIPELADFLNSKS
jgi:GYF domain 2